MAFAKHYTTHTSTFLVAKITHWCSKFCLGLLHLSIDRIWASCSNKITATSTHPYNSIARHCRGFHHKVVTITRKIIHHGCHWLIDQICSLCSFISLHHCNFTSKYIHLNLQTRWFPKTIASNQWLKRRFVRCASPPFLLKAQRDERLSLKLRLTPH